MNKVFNGFVAAFLFVLNAHAVTVLPSDKADAEKVWEKQYNMVMQENPGDSLVLVGYKEKKVISSARKLKAAVESVFADDSYIAIQNHVDYSFAIVPMSKASQLWDGYTKLKEEISSGAATHLNGGATLRLVKLEWKYKGKTYLSRALVTDEEGHFFDTIGYFVAIK